MVTKTPPKVAIVHTSFALVEALNALAKECLPGVGIITIVDDTALTYAREHGVDEALHARMNAYFRAAQAGGAAAILNVCSSVGETVDAARAALGVPILKIDEPMAEAAVQSRPRIAVLATVESTLAPTCRLIESKAREAESAIELSQHLCEGAFDALTAGRPDEHDGAVQRAIFETAPHCDVIVLAQASMARCAPQVEGRVPVPVLSSPRLAMQRLAAILEAA